MYNLFQDVAGWETTIIWAHRTNVHVPAQQLQLKCQSQMPKWCRPTKLMLTTSILVCKKWNALNLGSWQQVLVEILKTTIGGFSHGKESSNSANVV